MKVTLPRSRPSRREGPSRRQRVPPALTRGDDRFDGFAILDEVPEDVGVVLWQSVRNVFLWATTPPDRRAGLFAGEAADLRAEQVRRLELESELQAPLSVVVSMLRHPDRADVSRVVNACRRIALWAENRGALATALAFSQAAALCAPNVPVLAYAVGRMARRCAQYDRAESWYVRAVIQARQVMDWRIYALALSGMGTLLIQRGNYPAARKAKIRCLRASKRHGLTEFQATSYHDLFWIAVEMGNYGSAESLAYEAFRAYGDNPEMLPRLAYDIAYFWTQQGQFGPADAVARVLRSVFDGPTELALTLGLAARISGALGNVRDFEEARAHALDIIEAGAAKDAAASTLLGIGYGAAMLQQWAEAEHFVIRALEVASARHEGRLVMAAESALDSVRRRSMLAVRPQAASVGFAEELVSSLARLEGSGVAQ